MFVLLLSEVVGLIFNRCLKIQFREVGTGFLSICLLFSRNGMPLQYSCLENPMNRGAWKVIVHRVAKRHDWTHTHTHDFTHTYMILHTHTHDFIAPRQYSCLENPKDRGACWATVHVVAKNRTRLKRLNTHTHTHTHTTLAPSPRWD